MASLVTYYWQVWQLAFMVAHYNIVILTNLLRLLIHSLIVANLWVL